MILFSVDNNAQQAAFTSSPSSASSSPSSASSSSSSASSSPSSGSVFHDPTYDVNDEASRDEDEDNEQSEVSNKINSVDSIEKSKIENSSSAGVDESSSCILERKPRKRKAEPDKWSINETRRRRMEGKSYIGYRRVKGVITHDIQRPARELGPACTSKECVRMKNRNCSDLTKKIRQSIFTKFWGEMNWEQRRVFVINHVKKTPTKRVYTTNEVSKRKATFQYYLTVKGEQLQVCKKTFLHTTGLREYSVHAWVNSQSQESGITPCDKFKKEIKRKDRVPRSEFVERSNFAQQFLTDLPKLPSHYARATTTKQYLEPIVRSLNQLYELYCQKSNEEKKKPLSYCKFSHLFHELNLSIHPVKKDRCDICVQHEIGQMSDELWSIHDNEKKRARKEKSEDKERALQNECRVLCMDLEAVKVSPYVQASAIFYRTKLCCHNFTVYDLATKKACCFWFDETGADLTASTFASCLVQYLKTNCADDTGPIIIYSDGCTYQNRNNILANALLAYAVDKGVEIIQKFLVVGHTQMECDSVHATIETYLKGRDIYLPSDYIRFTREARKKPFPYDVVKIDFNDIQDYAVKSNQRYSSIRPGKVKDDPVVTDIRALKYSVEGIIFFKLSFDDEWKALPQRPKSITGLTVWPKLYKEPRKIKKEKYTHLKELKKIIPIEYHHFYDNIGTY